MRKDLQNAKLNVNFHDRNGMTALHYATVQDFAVIVEMLAKARADLDVADSNMRTPLILAASLNYLATAEILIKHGANMN